MATPPPPPPSQGGSPHLRRDLAESFGADAERYDRARPSYPAGLTDAVVAGIPGRSVLDVGIGTGISARPFRDAGYAVLGVEVDPKMAEVARRRGFEVEVAKFEDWDAAFTEPEQWRFDWETLVTREAWLDQVPTAGGHSRLPAAKLDALLDGMAEVVDAADGSFTMRYATVATAAVKVGTPTGR